MMTKAVFCSWMLFILLKLQQQGMVESAPTEDSAGINRTAAEQEDNSKTIPDNKSEDDDYLIDFASYVPWDFIGDTVDGVRDTMWQAMRFLATAPQALINKSKGPAKRVPPPSSDNKWGMTYNTLLGGPGRPRERPYTD